MNADPDPQPCGPALIKIIEKLVNKIPVLIKLETLHIRPSLHEQNLRRETLIKNVLTVLRIRINRRSQILLITDLNPGLLYLDQDFAF